MSLNKPSTPDNESITAKALELLSVGIQNEGVDLNMVKSNYVVAMELVLGRTILPEEFYSDESLQHTLLFMGLAKDADTRLAILQNHKAVEKIQGR